MFAFPNTRRHHARLLRPAGFAGTRRGRHQLGLCLSRASTGVWTPAPFGAPKACPGAGPRAPAPQGPEWGAARSGRPVNAAGRLGSGIRWAHSTPGASGGRTGPCGRLNGLIWYRLGCRPLPGSPSIHSSLSRSLHVPFAFHFKRPKRGNLCIDPPECQPPPTPEWP